MIFKHNPWTLFQINKEIKSLFQGYISPAFTAYTRLSNAEIMKFTQEQPKDEPKRNGQQWDKLLSGYIKTVDPPPPTSVKDLVTMLSVIYPKLKFLDSKLPLYGFMQDCETDDKRMVAQSYLWQGEADAIAMYNGKYTIVPRDAPVGHRRGNNPVEYVFLFFFRVMPLWGIDAVTIRLSMFFRVMPGIDAVTIRLSMFFPRDAPLGHGRGNNPVEYVFFIFVTRSHKKQCRILIEV